MGQVRLPLVLQEQSTKVLVIALTPPTPWEMALSLPKQLFQAGQVLLVLAYFAMPTRKNSKTGRSMVWNRQTPRI